MKLAEALKGPLGGFDTARILFAVGGAVGVCSPPLFQAWALHLGQTWNAAEFCGGYFTGLGAYPTGGGLGISFKDKGVASAMNTTAPTPPEGGQP